MIGPFLPDVDYLGQVHLDFTYVNNRYEIEIVEPDLNKYKFLKFFVRQDLHYLHNDTVMIFLQTTKGSELLFVKPDPSQVFEYLEYRVRLSSEMFSGTTSAKLIFKYNGTGGAEMDLYGLQFGPIENLDTVILPMGISVGIHGAGLASILPGYNPVALNEVVDVKLYPYNGARVKKVVFGGDAYDENGVKHPRIIYDDFKIKYITAFENVYISIHFGRY